ncbi:3-methyladenine DNA glycosylase [bacterium]|nr:MAG: 3-methyladenine DNA glycosylase [bacterium]
MQRLNASEFYERKLAHENRVKERLSLYLDKREAGAKHPAIDFLFDYYSFRPGLLERFSAGFDVKLDKDCKEIPNESLFVDTGDSWMMDLRQFPSHRFHSLLWLIDMLEKTQEHEPQFGCLGMHEWAMVYKEETDKRHKLPLRLSPEATQRFVESRPIRCTHYDAFRFFTQPAKPLNAYQLTKPEMPEMEQGGCIHTNMDVYRWAFKFYPWIDSETIWEAFDLAWNARWIDMKASPYDVSGLGEINIPIETKEGAEEYVREQKKLYQQGVLIRRQLIEKLKKLEVALRVEENSV